MESIALITPLDFGMGFVGNIVNSTEFQPLIVPTWNEPCVETSYSWSNLTFTTPFELIFREIVNL